MNYPKQVRQGDVLLVAVDAIPPGAVLRKRNEAFVGRAYGEVTGHAHVVDDRRATLPAEMYDSDRGPYLQVAPGTRLVHTDDFATPQAAMPSTQEHSTVLVERTYRIVNQRQYTPWGEQNVAD